MIFKRAEKTVIRKFWEENANFSDRPRIDFDNNPNFSETTRQLTELTKAYPYLTNLIELGSGSGEYLDYLSTKFAFGKILGSDVKSPRLERAQQTFPKLKFKAADALKMVKKYNKPGTIFLAMNVLASLTPEEMKELFSKLTIPGTAFVFCDSGLPPEHTESNTRFDKQYNHNIIDYLRDSELTVKYCKISYDGNEAKRSVYLITGIVAQN